MLGRGRKGFGEAGTPFEQEKDPLIKRETLRARIISGSPTARGAIGISVEVRNKKHLPSLPHYSFSGVARGPMPVGKYVILLTILLSAAACGDTWGQRAVTGGAIGAGSGAVLGAVTPLGILPGALIGGAVGAGVGAATTPGR
jgi:hypothetical protein